MHVVLQYPQTQGLKLCSNMHVKLLTHLQTCLDQEFLQYIDHVATPSFPKMNIILGHFTLTK